VFCVYLLVFGLLFPNFIGLFFCDSYSILAPNAIPQGFVDGKQVTDKILTALQLDTAEYRLGTTKVRARDSIELNPEIETSSQQN
jgi:myosin heavy chain 6/7